MVVVAKQQKSKTVFGRRLRELREAKGLTQAALGKAADNMQGSAIARLEAGDRSPSWETVLKLAEALGVEPNDFKGTDTEPPATDEQPVAP